MADLSACKTALCFVYLFVVVMRRVSLFESPCNWRAFQEKWELQTDICRQHRGPK